MTQMHQLVRIGEDVMLVLDRILGSFRVKASQQSMGYFAGRLLAIFLAFAGAAANADEVIYGDSLENGFLDYSYTSNGGTVDFASTAQAHGGTQSIAFTPGGFDAVKFAYNTAVLDTATYSTLTFWYYGTSSQCQALKIILEKTDGVNDNEVASGTLSGYSVCNVTIGTWNEITIDFTAPPMSFNGAYDRISIADGTGATLGTVYFDDVSLGSSVVDEIFANGFESGTVSPPPVNGLVEDHDVTVLSMLSDRFTWKDSSANSRVAVLAHNDAATAGSGGTRGGELRQFQYQNGGSTRTVSASGSGASGFGYVVSHPNEGDESCIPGPDSSSLGHFTPGTWTRVFEGRHHAIFRFQQNYPRYCSTVGAVEHDIPVTIDWTFSTGRDNPLWSISYDLSGVAVNVLEDDSRAPYGELLFDGSATEGAHSVISGVGWGDGYQFTSTTNPVTYNSAWTWNVLNTIPYVKLWTTAIDATMGTVQTQTLSQQDAGGYFDATRWGTTSASGNACAAGDDGPDAHLMPCSSNWDYQSINYSMGEAIGGSNSDSTNNTRLAWGTEFGFLGQSSYSVNGSSDWGGPRGNLTASGWPKKSYSVYVVLGSHATDAVAAQVTQMETEQKVSLAASVGSVATSGPAGVNRTDTVTYSPAGYDPVYGALVFNATGNAVTATIGVSSGTLKNPMIIIRNYTSGSYPTTVKFGGTALTMDADYFPSLRSDKSELWITLNKNISGASNAFQIIP
jgi:hypothetical protein